MNLQRQKERYDYLTSLFRYDFEFNRMYDETMRKEREGVDLQPAITPQAGKLLAFLLKGVNAKRVLEIGTGIGYSSHWLAGVLLRNGGKLVTVDSHHRTPQEAKKHFVESGVDGVVEMLHLEAERVLPSFPDGSFDFILQDGGKSFYLPLYDECYRLLKKGGIWAVDDVLFPFEEKARESQQEKIRLFNEKLAKDERYYTITLDIGHGLTLAIKEQ